MDKPPVTRTKLLDMKQEQFNLLKEYTDHLAEEIAKKREIQVREAFKQRGYEFSTDKAYYRFVEKHCSLDYTVRDAGNLITIFLNGKPFITWIDSIQAYVENQNIHIIQG